MVNAYRAILTKGSTAYGTVLRHILEHQSDDSSIIIHCTAGKDRTGVLSALILSLCGVSDDDVATEYNLTEAGLGAWTEHLVRAVMQQGGGGTETSIRRMLGARRESMLDTLEMVRTEFGGVEAYFENVCGLTKQEIAQIKKFLVVERDAEPSK